LAGPLHEARHAGEPLEQHFVTLLDAAQPLAGDEAPAEGDNSAACLWCLFHADQGALNGSPPDLRFHAESSAPPALTSCGLAIGRCLLAAQPRGPPLV
jgi:hypothetical protein